MQYFAGGFNGSKDEYLKMSKELSSNIDKDFNNGIIAVWHDESHINRYFASNPPTAILDPGYCYGESFYALFIPDLTVSIKTTAKKQKLKMYSIYSNRLNFQCNR